MVTLKERPDTPPEVKEDSLPFVKIDMNQRPLPRGRYKSGASPDRGENPENGCGRRIINLGDASVSPISSLTLDAPPLKRGKTPFTGHEPGPRVGLRQKKRSNYEVDPVRYSSPAEIRPPQRNQTEPKLTVFEDMNGLMPGYIPEVILHREMYLERLHGLFEGFLRHPAGTHQRIVQVLGPPGSGKTCTVNGFGRRLQRSAEEGGIPLRYVHVNCKLERGLFDLYQGLLMRLFPELKPKGQSTGETLKTLVRLLRERSLYLLLALDDADCLVKKTKAEEPEGGIVYDMTRLGEIEYDAQLNVVGVIFVARDEAFRSLLDPSERSSLGGVVIRMPGYDASQLVAILEARAEVSFAWGTVGDEILEYIADLTAESGTNPGDCRFALDVLLTAGLIADGQLNTRVSLEHVRLAVREMIRGISTEELMDLDQHQILVYRCAVEALQIAGKAYASAKAAYELCMEKCEAEGEPPLTYKRVLEIVKDLHYMGALEYSGDRGVSIAGATLKDLSCVLRSIERRKKLAEEAGKGDES